MTPAAVPDQIQRTIDDIYARGQSGGADIFPSALPAAAGAALRDLALELEVARTIEIGLAHGLSALWLCNALVRSGGDVSHYAIDPHQRSLYRNSGLDNLRRAGVHDMVEFVEEESQLVLPRLADRGSAFDLAFVDGSHNFDGVFVDLFFLSRLVKPGGIIVVDDVWLPSMRLAVNFFSRNLDCELVDAPFPPRGSYLDTRAGRWLRRARLAVLRTPRRAPKRTWKHLVRFC